MNKVNIDRTVEEMNGYRSFVKYQNLQYKKEFTVDRLEEYIDVIVSAVKITIQNTLQ